MVEVNQFKLKIALLAVLSACLLQGAHPAHATERIYELLYVAEIDPGNARAEMSLTLIQPRDLVRELRFRIELQRHTRFEGDGTIEKEGNSVRWSPPETGGELRWRADLESRRNNGAYDGMITPDWAIFRGDDLVPPVYSRSLKGAQSQARLRFELPDGWSAITPYRKADDGDFVIVNPDRNFDRPTGWIALGELGIRWATISGTQVAVAGPKGQGLRRQDMLAFLRWTLPTLRDIFPSMSDRLLLVGAGDPMWRGGLSGPSSLYIHADRPLISENGTSTLLHELVHVATALRADQGADWIVEGLAEYYSLQVLVRSGTISSGRFRKSLERVKEWGKNVDDLPSGKSRGEVTARAVAILQTVDENIRSGSDNIHSLDELVRTLVSEGSVSNERFFEIAVELAGKPVKVLDPLKH
jgi:hypothetical protein